MTALRALPAALLALALVLPHASATSFTVTDANGDSSDALGNYAQHLDIVEGTLGSSSGTVTITMTLDGLHASQPASRYSYRLVGDGAEYHPFCSLSGDGTQLTGSCGFTVTQLGLQQEESLLRGLPVLGPVLAIVLDLFVWETAEHNAGSSEDVPVTATFDASTETITWTASAADLGLSSGDVVRLLHGGTSDCTSGCLTADNIYGDDSSFTVE